MDTRTLLLSTSTLEGNDVVNAEGESLGDIKDFMIDLDTGSIAYAVLSFGGFLGIGDKLFAVPMEALEIDTVNERFVLNVEKERLKEAPGFDEDNWPNHGETSFLDDVYTYYGYEPYETYRADRYSGYYERKRKAERGTTMDVVDSDHDGV